MKQILPILLALLCGCGVIEFVLEDPAGDDDTTPADDDDTTPADDDETTPTDDDDSSAGE